MKYWKHIGVALAACLLLVLMITPAVTAAEGLFGSFNQLYGTPLPSLRSVAGRNADTSTVTDAGKQQTWTGIDESAYLEFSLYLAKCSCTVQDWKASENVLDCTLALNGHTFGLQYNRQAQTLSLLYPEGTREEDQASGTGKTTTGILPSFKEAFSIHLPNLTAIAGAKPQSETTAQGQLILKYKDVTPVMYNKLSTALGGAGCTLASTDTERTVLTATLSCSNGSTLVIVYDYNAQTLQLTYPADVFVTGDASAVKHGTSVLPALDTFMAQGLPHLGNILQRAADSSSMTDSSIEERWEGFTEADYAAMSQYLLTKGCTLVSYSVDKQVATFNLSKNGTDFVIIYNRSAGTVTQITPASATMERSAYLVAVTTTPKPTPTSTPKPTPRPTSTPKAKPRENYTRDQCYNIAVNALRNGLRRPSSLELAETYRWSKDESKGTYTFYIDYSAMNGFGGYNRETFYVVVNYETGKVVSSYSY